MERARSFRTTFSHTSGFFAGAELASNVKPPALVVVLWQPEQYWFRPATGAAAKPNGASSNGRDNEMQTARFIDKATSKYIAFQ